MIREVTGDILLTSASAIAHGVGVNDDFKSELCASLRQLWPALYKDFRHFCQVKHQKPGTLWAWRGTDGKQIINLFTQEPPQQKGDHPGPAHTEYVNRALGDLRDYLLEEKVPSVALPRLATGVGGLEWSQVEPLIKKHLGDLNIPVYVYTTYRKNERADES